MIGRITLLVAILIGSLASAAEPQQITVWKLESGYYIVSGSQILSFPPNGPVVPPVTPDVPPVVPTTEFQKRVGDAVMSIPASDARHQAALKLTATYQMLAGQVRDGKIAPANAVAAAELICPIALGTDKGAWAPVFSVVNDAVSKAGTPEATAKVFADAADAVLSTVPNSEQALEAMRSGKMMGENEEMMKLSSLYGFDWDKFMTFLMDLFIKLLPLIISKVQLVAPLLIG